MTSNQTIFKTALCQRLEINLNIVRKKRDDVSAQGGENVKTCFRDKDRAKARHVFAGDLLHNSFCIRGIKNIRVYSAYK